MTWEIHGPVRKDPSLFRECVLAGGGEVLLSDCLERATCTLLTVSSAGCCVLSLLVTLHESISRESWVLCGKSNMPDNPLGQKVR